MILFHEHIESIFRAHKLSISSLCEKIGCSRAYIYTIWRRESVPTMRFLMKLFEHLEISEDRRAEILEAYKTAEADKPKNQGQSHLKDLKDMVARLEERVNILHDKFNLVVGYIHTQDQNKKGKS